MKWGVRLRDKTAEKRPKMAIFKLLVLSLIYAHYPIFFTVLIEKYEQVLCCVKIHEKKNLQIWISHIYKYGIFQTFQVRG